MIQRRRCCSLVVMVTLWTWAARAEEPDVPKDRPRSGILADPLDFSRPPTLPKIEAPTVEQIENSINRGVEFLLEIQNANGSWGSATKTSTLR